MLTSHVAKCQLFKKSSICFCFSEKSYSRIGNREAEKRRILTDLWNIAFWKFKTDFSRFFVKCGEAVVVSRVPYECIWICFFYNRNLYLSWGPPTRRPNAWATGWRWPSPSPSRTTRRSSRWGCSSSSTTVATGWPSICRRTWIVSGRMLFFIAFFIWKN